MTLAADLCGLIMGWVAQALVEPLSLHPFINSGFNGAGFDDFLPPTFETAVFGLIIGLIACFQGMRAQGGAAGVGRAATSRESECRLGYGSDSDLSIRDGGSA